MFTSMHLDVCIPQSLTTAVDVNASCLQAKEVFGESLDILGTDLPDPDDFLALCKLISDSICIVVNAIPHATFFDKPRCSVASLSMSRGPGY